MEELIVEQQLPIITSNFEAVKISLMESVEKYKNLIVTEEGLKGAKADQVTLSKLEKKIDDYRKSVKQEAEKPIKKFEGECKILIGLVSDARTPLKASIEVFDDKARGIKREIAQEHINKLTTDLLLNDKYGSQLIVSSEYTNVNMSVKKIKEDIEKRALLLQQEQQQEADNLQIIKNTIETVNKGIDAKMLLEDFKTEIELSPVINVIANINARAERIKANELKAVEDRKLKTEKEVLERIAQAEREAAEKTRIEERNIRIAEENIEAEKLKTLKEKERLNNVEYEAKLKLEHEAKFREMNRNINLESITEKLYFIDMKVINATMTEVKALSQFLKDNNYKYEATNKGGM